MQPDKPLSPIRPNFCPYCRSRAIIAVDVSYFCTSCCWFFESLAALPRPDWLHVGLETARTAAMVLARAEAPRAARPEMNATIGGGLPGWRAALCAMFVVLLGIGIPVLWLEALLNW